MLHWLFDTSMFFTRNHCGPGWDTTLIAVNRIANLLIFLAYFTIPLSLLHLWLQLTCITRRGHIAWRVLNLSRTSKFILLNFVLFILFCGLTHLCDVLVFDWAAYRLFTLVDVLTAVASVQTAIVLPGVLRSVLGALDAEGGGAGDE